MYSITNYETAKTFWETRRKRNLQNNTRLIKTENGFGIQLHDTVVVEYEPDRTILDSGGWKTPTTKERLNEYTPFCISQDKGVWYLGRHWNGENKVVFADKMFFAKDKWHNTGPDAKVIEKERKAVRKYAKAFVVALFAGEVPKPSGGDCWHCSMHEVETGKPLGELSQSDHIQGHIKESYFVPSLCVNACKAFGVSKAAWWALQELWEGEGKASSCFADVARRQIESAIRRYCYRQLGTPS